MDQQLLSLKQSAQYLNVTVGTLNCWIRDKVLIPICKDKGSRGCPQNLYRTSDLDALTQHPKWRGALQSPTEGRKLLVNFSTAPTSDEIHKTGCIIHWTERFRNGNHTYVTITCAMCHTKFTKSEGTLKDAIKHDTFTGCCTTCYPKSRGKWSYFPSNGKVIRSDGYVYRHIKTFTKEEQTILLQMPLNNNIYIAEHRAVLALQLGRPLNINEAVHHIDGDKQNNDIANLQLYELGKHSKLHSDNMTKILDLERRTELLEQENAQLRQLLCQTLTA